jgi:CheY-like chemotaxis protein
VSPKVLVVEDDAVLRRVIRWNLAKRGLEVREAETRAGAILTLAEARPDLLVLDLMLPDGSGGDVLREVRQGGSAVPTVLISAAPPRPSLLTEFGPLSFLAKPFLIEALLDLVGKAVGGWVIPDELALPLERAEPSASPTAAWLAELRTLCITLVRTSESRLRVMSSSFPLPRDDQGGLPLATLASAVAQEYGLVARTEVHGGYVRVRLNRRPETIDRERGDAL